MAAQKQHAEASVARDEAPILDAQRAALFALQPLE
jgi:hypothetical protein